MIEIEGKKYQVIDEYIVNLVDSFVAPKNKTGVGSGEARLYVGSQTIESKKNFFDFSPVDKISGYESLKYEMCLSKCFLYKDNLLEFMDLCEDEYIDNSYDYRSVTYSLFEKRLKTIIDLNEYEYFYVHNQTGTSDGDRFYIGSRSPQWKLLRELSIPFLSKVIISKLVNENNTCYYFRLIFAKGSTDSFEEIIKYANKQRTELEERSIEEVHNTSIDTTEKIAIIKARKGQGRFRKNTFLFMNTCPFTGVDDKSFLRASHIIPWVECQTNDDRLNGHNGLLLTPTYDFLFDKGYISFENSGRIIISNTLPEEYINALHLEADRIYDISNKDKSRNKFLKYHRDRILKK